MPPRAECLTGIDDLSRSAVPCGLLERMPKWLICIPLACQWLWLACRFRSWTLPSAANPHITAGGLVGEGKMEYFHGMGPVALAMTARSCAITNSQWLTDAHVAATMRAAGLRFPLVAKPDLGLCGYGVRRINSLLELRVYLTAFPRDEVVVLQAYLNQAGEAGIFYARDPQTDQASLIGLALRSFPSVCGDGCQSLAALIAADPRARRVLQSGQHQAPMNLARIPALGEVVRLSTIGSTRVGGLYRDGAQYITPALTVAIDAIARQMPEFYCGRFDVRFETTQQMAAGFGFTIMEINGAGSEAIQAWDPQMGLINSFKIIFAKQRRLFEIGAANRRRGTIPIGLVALTRLYRRQQRLIAQYPLSN